MIFLLKKERKRKKKKKFVKKMLIFCDNFFVKIFSPGSWVVIIMVVMGGQSSYPVNMGMMYVQL